MMSRPSVRPLTPDSYVSSSPRLLVISEAEQLEAARREAAQWCDRAERAEALLDRIARHADPIADLIDQHRKDSHPSTTAHMIEPPAPPNTAAVAAAWFDQITPRP